MTDREKVVSEFERCIGSFSPADTSDEYFKCVCKRALELLKEQNGVPYVFDADGETACGVCGCHFDKAYGNCPQCGKKVKWDD